MIVYDKTYTLWRYYMSGSVNKVTLVGNLGRDPEVRAMQNGDKIESGWQQKFGIVFASISERIMNWQLAILH